jgi:hypothetical protein
MTQTCPPVQQPIPAPIQWAINVYGERLRRVDALGGRMANLELRITETEKMLRQMRNHYAALGREHTMVHGDAELLLLMIQHACTRVGIDVPLQGDPRPPRNPQLPAAPRDAPARTPRAIGQSTAIPRDKPADSTDDKPADQGVDKPAGHEAKPAEQDAKPAEQADDASDAEDRAAAEDDAPADAADTAALDQVVRERYAAGASQRAIANELNIDRRRVKRILAESPPKNPDQIPEHAS